MIYVMRAGDTGPCKVGFASNVSQRLKALQTGHHERLRVLHVWEGDRDVEARLHRCLAAHRLHGEWFEPVERLISGEIINDEPPAAPAPIVSTATGMEALRAQRGVMARVAKALGVTRAAVCMWTKVPAERVPAVSAASGVPAHVLRPDLYGAATLQARETGEGCPTTHAGLSASFLAVGCPLHGPQHHGEKQ